MMVSWPYLASSSPSLLINSVVFRNFWDPSGTASVDCCRCMLARSSVILRLAGAISLTILGISQILPYRERVVKAEEPDLTGLGSNLSGLRCQQNLSGLIDLPQPPAHGHGVDALRVGGVQRDDATPTAWDET